MPTLIEQEKAIETKRAELSKLFQDHQKDGSYDFTANELTELNQRNDELSDMCKAYEGQRNADVIRKENERQYEEMKRLAAPPMPNGHSGNGHGPNSISDTARMVENAYKSFGQLCVESKAFTDYHGGDGPISELPDFNLKAYFDARNEHFGLRGFARKATMLTSAGWAPEVTRGPKVLLSALEMPAVTDLIPQTTTTQAAIRYMEETTFTNNAAPVSEGAVKPESALALTERTIVVSKIATHIPASKEQLEDVPRTRDYIDNRVTTMLEQTLEAQILNGTGTPPQLAGVLSAFYTNMLTQPRGTDPGPDALFKAMTQIRVTGKASASGIVMHPNDWANIRLLRTVDGIYLWGNPSDPGADRIWGLPVIVTANMTAGIAVVADWANYSELASREGITIQVGYINDDYTRNLVRILGELRAAFLIYRQTAFCKVTGL